jgi:hypothetical protein
MWKKIRTVILEHWPLLLLLAMAAVVHRDLLAHLPGSGDHHCHFFKGWLLAEHFIPSGRITGWSHMAYAGFPAGMYYPVGGELYLVALRALSLGLTGWDMVFKLSIFLLMVAMPAIVYGIARRAMGVPWAFLAGFFALGDVGGFRQGGSVHTLYWGVWPFALSVIAALVALLAFERSLAGARGRRFAWPLVAAAALAFSVLAHPMSAVYLAVALPVLLVCFILLERERAGIPRLVITAAAIGVAALLLAAFWLVPYALEAKELSITIGEDWLDAGEILDDALEGKVFEGYHPVLWVAGFAGLILGIASRRTWPTFLAASTILLFAMGIVGGELFAGMIQYERLAAYLRTSWFALAALGFAGVAAFLGRRLARLRPALGALPRWKIRLAEQGLVLALAAGSAAVEWSRHFGRIPTFVPLADGTWENERAVAEWLAGEERYSLDRVLIQAGKVCTSGNLNAKECRKGFHNHLYESFPVLSGLPKVRFGFQPAEGFENLPLPRSATLARRTVRDFLDDPETLVNLGIRWIVSRAPVPERGDLDLVAHIGPLRVYEVTSAPEPARLIGPGALWIERFDDERITLDVAHPGPDSVVQLAVSAHPYWRATEGGRELPITPRPISRKQKRAVLMSFPAKEGRIEVVFRRPWFRTAAERTSGAAWSLLLAALLFGAGRALVRGFGRLARGARPGPFDRPKRLG